jgi:hypothetical protein
MDLPSVICSLLTLDHYVFAPPALYLYPEHHLFATVKFSAFRPSRVRHFTLIFKLTIPSNLWLYRISSCSHTSVLCLHRPLNAGLYPGDPFFLLILWSCKLINPSLPTVFCFHSDHPWSSPLIYVLFPDHLLLILLIYVCIRLSTLRAT